MCPAEAMSQTLNTNIKKEQIEYMLPTPAATPEKRSRASSSDFSDASIIRTSARKRQPSSRLVNNDQPKRSRGRPPITEPLKLSISDLRMLSKAELRNKELRMKNNEASRRSRLNRKGKEMSITDQLRAQETRYAALKREEKRIDQEWELWKKRVFKLATI